MQKPDKTRRSSINWQHLERIPPWLVLAILATYTYAKFFEIPYAGFDFTSGKIFGVYVTVDEGDSLQEGDQLVQIGPVLWDDFLKDLRQTVFDGVEIGQIVPMLVEREGQIVSINWVFPGPNLLQILERLNGIWWLAYVFWMAGTATLLFVRPKDTRWRLLVAFNYLTAIWLAAGSGPSHWHIWESAIVLRAFIWLSLPVYLHFHWVFPKPFRRLPAFVWVALYLIGVALFICEWFQILPTTAFFSGFLFAMGGSIVLLGMRVIMRPAQRRDIGMLVAAAFLVLVPPIGVSIAYLAGLQPSVFIQGGSFIALPALPGAYFYIIFRQQFRGLSLGFRANRLFTRYLMIIILGTGFVLFVSLLDARYNLMGSILYVGVITIVIAAILAFAGFLPFLAIPALAEQIDHPVHRPGELGFRANRLLSFYLFFVLIGSAMAVMMMIASASFDSQGAVVLISLMVVALTIAITAFGFSPFQHYIDRQLLGMPLPPTRLLESYADQITTSLERSSLVHLLKDKILASLLVRQSALLWLDDKEQAFPLYTAGVDDSKLPNQSEIAVLIDQTREYGFLTSRDLDHNSWIRLAFPLHVGGKTYGLWLLGHRDPDDIYTHPEISVLKFIANQTTIAMINIAQAERLRDLYKANIERHEIERANLARNLHDEVLNRLASLSMVANEPGNPNSHEVFRKITTSLRQMIRSLRPAMLAYGLRAAMEEMVEEFSERMSNDTMVLVDLPPSEARYEPRIEEHLYRIVQQSCENALRHAQATTIRISGELEPGRVRLTVEDDGVGFADSDQLNFDRLVANRHFGLAGMHERAALIGAELTIDSQPGEGTRVTITWKPGE